MQVVIKVVSFVKSRDAEHSTLLLYTALRWLSCGSTLKRVFVLRNEVKDFLHNRKNENTTFFQRTCSLLALRSWLMFPRNNDVNISLQGRGKCVFELQTSIRAFVNKLAIFIM